MELKDSAVALAGVSVILIGLGLFTDGIAFYVATGLALAAAAIDLGRFQLTVRDLQRNLRVTRELFARKMLLGSAMTATYDLDYAGRRAVPVSYAQPASAAVEVKGSPADSGLFPGHKTIAFSLRPLARGSHVVKGLQITVESALFRGTLTAGGESQINACVAMCQERSGVGMGRGNFQRLAIPGNEALRKGTGSDFSHIRNFMPGDSTRNIDWARSTRSSTLVVRDFEDERTMPLFILIDVDPSMNTGTGKTEIESAVEMARVMAGRVLLDNERVGVACFSKSDVVSYLAPSGGKGQMEQIRTLLSAAAARGTPMTRTGYPSLQEARARLEMLENTAAGATIAPLLEEIIRQFSANVREDGFIKAMVRASHSLGTHGSIVVITNLSVGMASLLNGSRIATYYGHNVSVALAPHIWYGGPGNDDPEKCYERYRQAKEAISRLRGQEITVMELCAYEKPENSLHQGRIRGSIAAARQRR
jgi:uncharacterized protein (DUF58 family)